VGTQPAWKPERNFSGDSERIELEAARWLIVMDGEPSIANQRALYAWLSSRARHRAAFLRLSVAWRRVDRLRVYSGERLKVPTRSFRDTVPLVLLATATVLIAAVLAIWLR
jgi:ferric-dicitrate binding protein FerR (iron transport regulator)